MDRSLFAIVNLGLIVGAAFVGMRMYLRSNPDLSSVRGSRLIGSSVRGWFFTNVDPFEELFVRWRVSASAITLAQLAGSVACGLAYANGLVFSAGFLLWASGSLDVLDGRLARRTSSASKAGAFLDSVVDRYCEFIVFAGLIIFFESGWVVWAVLFALLGGMMVSYTRARAEGLGQTCSVGMMQRPERFVLLGFGSVFSSIATHALGGHHDLLAAVILFLAVSTNLTALQRFIHVHRALRGAARESAGA